MIRFRSLLMMLGVALVACGVPMTTTRVPPQAPPKEGLPSPATATAVAVSTPAPCASTNAAPPDKFRADDPAKFAANTGKPKLIEFFTSW